MYVPLTGLFWSPWKPRAARPAGVFLKNSSGPPHQSRKVRSEVNRWSAEVKVHMQMASKGPMKKLQPQSLNCQYSPEDQGPKSPQTIRTPTHESTTESCYMNHVFQIAIALFQVLPGAPLLLERHCWKGLLVCGWKRGSREGESPDSLVEIP